MYRLTRIAGQGVGAEADAGGGWTEDMYGKFILKLAAAVAREPIYLSVTYNSFVYEHLSNKRRGADKLVDQDNLDILVYIRRNYVMKFSAFWRGECLN